MNGSNARPVRLVAAVITLALAGTAAADMGAPKRPIGFPRPNLPVLPVFPNPVPNPPVRTPGVPVDHVFTIDKDYPDYVFFKVVNDRALQVEFTAKVPVSFRAAKLPATVNRLEIAAVPKEAKKKYKNEYELLAAVVAGKIPGQVNTKGQFPQVTVLDPKDTRQSVTLKHPIENIDPKDGFVFAPEKPKGRCDADAADDADPDTSAADDTDFTVAAVTPAPAGRLWVAGLAAFAAFASAGMWLTRRRVSPSAE